MMTVSPFPFLDLPRELRDKVYKELVTDNQNFVSANLPELRWPKNFSGLNLLHVNRQIRSEAWDMLANGNIWIQIRLCGPPDMFPVLLEDKLLQNPRGKPATRAVFPTNGFPPDSIRRLRESSIITVCLGDEDGIKDEDKVLEANFKGMVLLLPYQQSMWPLFACRLGWHIANNPYPQSIHITCRSNVLQGTAISRYV